MIPDGNDLQAIAHFINDKYKCGFALIVFEFGGGPKISNYISNGQRKDMIDALKETIARLESKQDFITPNNN